MSECKKNKEETKKLKEDILEIQKLWLDAHTKTCRNFISDIERWEQDRLGKWLGELLERKIEDFKYITVRESAEIVSKEDFSEFVALTKELNDMKKKFFIRVEELKR